MPSSNRFNRVFMSYENQPGTATASIRSTNDRSSSLYSQRNSLADGLFLVSRSLRRMQIEHAVMGDGALALEDPSKINAVQKPGECRPEIELIMSPDHYAKFRSSWVNQRLAAIDAEDHQFWDNRTGYLLCVYVTGDWVKLGRRAFRVPEVAVLPKTDDRISYWIPDFTDTRRSASEERRIREKGVICRSIAA